MKEGAAKGQKKTKHRLIDEKRKTRKRKEKIQQEVNQNSKL